MKVVPVQPSDEKLLRSAERVHRQLRPHLKDYVGRMKEVLGAGAEMAVCMLEGEVAGVTVFRVLEKTHSGRDLYCDDLVTDEAKRSAGVGHALIQYMEGICRE
ncbi:MAG TPA: GNAT family N-acetyltransferase, partial [Usitatibacter sp.]|nr:GNAT family N-acetyltransferase [Usitatibacter sp.]